MEVYNDARQIESDLDIVLDKWKDDYYSLFGSRTINTGEYDSEFYDYVLTQLQILENIENEDNELNSVISINEVNNVVKISINNKAVGIDNIPYEIMKNQTSFELLTLMFNKIFDYGITPSLWRFAVLKPIPKSSLCNPRTPTQYRPISLLSTVGKYFLVFWIMA